MQAQGVHADIAGVPQIVQLETVARARGFFQVSGQTHDLAAAAHEIAET